MVSDGRARGNRGGCVAARNGTLRGKEEKGRCLIAPAPRGAEDSPARWGWLPALWRARSGAWDARVRSSSAGDQAFFIGVLRRVV